MQASFTDLVGTSIVPAHCFDTTELTDLTPALDGTAGIHEMTPQASEAKRSSASFLGVGPCECN